MSKQKYYTFQQDLKDRLKNPEFKQAWKNSEPEFLLAKQLIDQRLALKLSQRDLAKKLGTSQAAVSRIEAMRANPSLSFLKRLAAIFGNQLKLSI